jgi:hypothetical protein
MKTRLLFLVVVLCVSLISTASAAPLAKQGVASLPVSGTANLSGGGALVEAVHWIVRLWETATATSPPPPGTNNGSCVDPDGSTCRSS